MKRSLFALLIPMLVLCACSDDATGPTGDRLSREEAWFVASQMLASGDQTTFTAQQSAGLNARIDPHTLTQDLKLSHPCPLGGNVQLSLNTDLTFDQEIGLLDLDVEGSLTHAACAFRREGITIMVDGNPDIELAAHAELRNHLPSGEHTLEINGGFRWSTSDGRSGTCPISVEAVTNFVTRTRTVEGDVCGLTFNETLTWS